MVTTRAAPVLVKAKRTWDGQLVSLQSLVTTCHGMETTDIRDKMFGVLSLASKDLSQIIDYSLTPEDLLYHVIDVVCQFENISDLAGLMRFAFHL